MESIESAFIAKRKYEAEALDKAKFSVQKISALSNETVKNFNLKSRKEQELVRGLKEQIENDVEVCEREHKEKIQEVI